MSAEIACLKYLQYCDVVASAAKLSYLSYDPVELSVTLCRISARACMNFSCCVYPVMSNNNFRHFVLDFVHHVHDSVCFDKIVCFCFGSPHTAVIFVSYFVVCYTAIYGMETM